MSVHEAISAHSRKQHAHLEAFQQLDDQRERAIEEAVTRCTTGLPHPVDEINRLTRQINEHALHGISPTRVYVTEAMIEAYVAKTKRAE